MDLAYLKKLVGSRDARSRAADPERVARNDELFRPGCRRPAECDLHNK